MGVVGYFIQKSEFTEGCRLNMVPAYFKKAYKNKKRQ